METFGSLGILSSFEEKLSSRSIVVPTSVQRQVIPLLLAGKNIIFRSATGTGKTFAYLLPAIQNLAASQAPDANTGKRPYYEGPMALILAPTLELCSQIKAEIDFLSPFNSALLIGSTRVERQIESLKKSRPLIAVGNPGRLLLLAKMGKIKLKNIAFLILDEADRFASTDCLDETRQLLALIEQGIRSKNAKDGKEPLSGFCFTACSATVTAKTRALLGSFFESAKLVENDEHEILRQRIEHWALFSEYRQKIQTLRSLLAALKVNKPGFKVLIFAASGEQSAKILSRLQYHNIKACGLIGKVNKKAFTSQERKAALDSFRSGKINVLVSTDLAARGLDITGLTHIISMDVPEDGDTYIHRAGRTGRAGKKGVMISIGDEHEMRRLVLLEKRLKIMVRPKELYYGRICSPADINSEHVK